MSCKQMNPKGNFFKTGTGVASSCCCAELPGFCLFQERVSSKAEILQGKLLTVMKTILKANMDKQVSQIHPAQISQMQNRLIGHQKQFYDFESVENQAKALSIIPLDVLEKRAQENENPLPGRDELLRQLLHWFKREFFKWVNQPDCDTCASPTSAVGGDVPTAEERKYGAGRVELYRCTKCNAFTRFPRYNNSGKLMETRRGRCGEWAQAFTLCCRALRFDARIVFDWTDHVWTEVWSDEIQRWVHCDSCEDAYDSPFMYEVGWGKKLNYMIAFSAEEVRDVSRRYTRNYADLLTRRKECAEDWLETFTESFSEQLISKLPTERQTIVRARWIEEKKELAANLTDEDRKLKDSELIGRKTGSVEWRKMRGELGKVQAESKQEQCAPEDAKKPKCGTSETDKVASTHEISPVEEVKKPTLTPEEERAQLKLLIQGYFLQLTKDCAKNNHSQFCKQSGEFAFRESESSSSAQDWLKRAIQIATEHGKSKLCK
eukprot:TRINITY_DN4604_c0_g1_i2.p1 TRINITY_DN4604_c0_g1~~TRINITY_DN4604_c0_g1_i2.p1  ORF type:complete len:491 (-),score=123.26 TRINITY_DN4604_c0_g1_i2:112-1584(-)